MHALQLSEEDDGAHTRQRIAAALAVNTHGHAASEALCWLKQV